MKFAFIVLAFFMSSLAQAGSYEDEFGDKEAHEKIKPKCTNIRFTGVAAAGRERDIEDVLASHDIKDTLARNPIRCHFPGGGLMETCDGVAYFENHKGRIVNWTKKSYLVMSPVDFNDGRKDIRLLVHRKDSRCAK